MSSHSAPFSASIDQLDDFDTIIDVRSPSEFAEDHIPGAINCPVLDDEERIRVGTLYKQVSPFEARKVGAVLVSRNIARHIETHFLSKPKGWKPLIYCWRGGQRSGSMTVVFGQIGWAARRLEGGYKNFRQRVLEDLDTLPSALDFRILCGPTGSGKTALLDALAAAGEPVLDLEGLAAHSRLGAGGCAEQQSALPEGFRDGSVGGPARFRSVSSGVGRVGKPAGWPFAFARRAVRAPA